MFQIQRTLQRKVFGIRYWEKVERSSKESFNGENRNEFNPRHVQILLRTYQTGGAAAVLSHTGDPNKGLRDWYENQKEHDVIADDELADEAENGAPKTGLQRWDSLRDTMVTKKAKAAHQWGSVRRNLLDGQVIKQHTLERARSGLKRSKPKQRSDVEIGSAENSAPNDRPTSAGLPVNVAKDLARIRARRKTGKGSRDGHRPRFQEESNEPTSRVAADPPANEANDPPAANESHQSNAQTSRPTSALPANVADDLKRIRERRNQRPVTPIDGPARPPSAGLPANVAADLQRIRARRTKKGNIDEHNSNRGKRKDRPRPRKSTAVHNNVRRRQAGSMFYKSDSHREGQPKGWLE